MKKLLESGVERIEILNERNSMMMTGQKVKEIERVSLDVWISSLLRIRTFERLMPFYGDGERIMEKIRKRMEGKR